MKSIFVLFLILATAATAQPQWQPHVIWDRSGITDSSAYGYKILPLGDQNNDGFADWAVFAQGNGGGYHGTRASYLEFFHGGNPPSQEPYFVFRQDSPAFYQSWFANIIGDINGDGYQDWMTAYWPQGFPQSRVYGFFFGGHPPDNTPDFEWPVSVVTGFYALAHFDFNGDGIDDLFGVNNETGVVRIYYGGTPLDTIADWVLYQPPQGLNQTYPSAVGDFNGDGASDFLCFNPNNGNIAIFLGGAEPDTIPAYIWTNMMQPIAGIRSLNGDAADEFLLGLGVHFGSSILSPFPNYTLQFSCQGTGGGFATSAGDYNNDGYRDLLIWTPSCTDNMFGSLDLYLGHPWLNPQPVITIDGWTDPLNLIGIYTAAGLGDVNGDGIDDIAIGAWDDFAYLGWRGRCIILSGDTTLHVDAKDPFILHSSSFILSCFPNPFNASTTISFTLPRAGEVKINVYDVLGREAKSAQPCGATMFTAGEHHVPFDGSALPSGIYFVQVQCGMYQATQKLMLLK